MLQSSVCSRCWPPFLLAISLQGDYDGRTGLHVAAAEGQLAAVTLLLEQGADPTLKDRFGFTPVDDARRTRRNDLILLLSDWSEKTIASRQSAAAGNR